jgi:peptide/nickel transport system substrate-binding protein
MLLGALLAASAAGAQTFRYASSGDIISLDPHSGNEALTNGFKQNLHEGLTRYDADLKIEPALAESWTNVDPVTWRFRLRRGVTFHDGKPFTADDVVFSFKRQRAKNSGNPEAVATIKEVRKLDDYTVEYVTDGPDPLLLRNLAGHYIVSKRWCEEHNGLEPTSAMDQESYSARHENGTGPFQVQERVPDTRTVLVPSPRWWDLPNKKYSLTRAEFRPIASAGTRLAALISGEQDLVWPVAPQDVPRVNSQPGFRVLARPELRVLYLAMDQWRTESLDMPGSGKNPFKDVRVRRAVYQAIDIEAIRSKVMRGMAAPTGELVPQGAGGYDPALRERLPYDPAGARKLLAEAGYPDGFPLTLDCPNDRYVNDEAICQSMVSMLGRVGIRVALNAQTKAKHLEKARSHNSSFHLMGWSPVNLDAMSTFVSLLVLDMPAGGVWNSGRYHNPRFEELASAARVEMDPAKRQKLISEAMRIQKEEIACIPLFESMVVWGVRDGVEVNPDPRDQVILRFVSVRK